MSASSNEGDDAGIPVRVRIGRNLWGRLEQSYRWAVKAECGGLIILSFAGATVVRIYINERKNGSANFGRQLRPLDDDLLQIAVNECLSQTIGAAELQRIYSGVCAAIITTGVNQREWAHRACAADQC